MHVVSEFREKQMDRRKFIKTAGIATGAAAATTLATPAIAQAKGHGDRVHLAA